MDFQSEVLRLTQRFYTAALSDSGWAAALDPMVELLRADHAIIVARAPYDKKTAIAASAGLNEPDFARFMSPEADRMMAPLRATLRIGEAMIGSEHVPERHYENSKFYNEIVRPAGGFHSVAARNEQPALSCFVSICRSRQAGDFKSSDAVLLQAVLPHLVLAIELHCKWRIAEQGRRQIGHVLDHLDAGIVLTDAKARPFFVNAYAARLIAAEDGVALNHRGLAAATPEATQRLRAVIAAICSRTVLENRHIRLKRMSGGPPLMVTVMPVWQFDAAIAGAAGPSVAIVIREPVGSVTVARLDAAGDFHLTVREKEVASLLAAGFKRLQIAGKLGISEATVKTHLQHLFEKTGTRRQIDLVRRLVEHTSSSA